MLSKNEAHRSLPSHQLRMKNKVLLLVFLSILNNCKCFQDDSKPHLIVTKRATSGLASFIGTTTSNEDDRLLNIQEIKIINDKVVIGCRNAVYVISTNSFSQATGNIAHDQILRWEPGRNVKRCEQLKSSKRTCQNYIRVVELVSPDQMLLCGTNAAGPTCRSYQWSQSRFVGSTQHTEMDGIYKVPFDDAVALAYQHADGHLFSATPTTLSGQTPSVIRTTVLSDATQPSHNSSRFNPLKILRTDDFARPFWLNRPHFVGMVDSLEKVYIFFREEALDVSDPTEKVVYSRVARVCKKDRGGTVNVLNGKWTSFFKARLNCSIPGEPPFHFNEIQHVTSPVIINGTKIVFVTMTTPENSIAGSAVCAYTLFEVERVMAGTFKEQDPNTMCWKQKIPNSPRPLPTICRDYETSLDDKTLNFIKRHSLMSDSVQPVGGKPLFFTTQTKSRFTAIAVEANVVGTNGNEVTVLYIGTSTGKLLKVTVDGNSLDVNPKTKFSEEWEVFQEGPCSRKPSAVIGSTDPTYEDARGFANNTSEDRRVRNVTVIPNSHVVLAAFQHCIISVPKRACYYYKCESDCVQSGNPYCGWEDGYCVPLTQNNRPSIQQDLFGDETIGGKCSRKGNHGVIIPVVNDEAGVNCTSSPASSGDIVLPLMLGLTSTFAFVLLMYLLIVHCKERSSASCCCISSKDNTEYGSGSQVKNNTNSNNRHRRLNFFVRHSSDEQPRVTVEAAVPIVASVRESHENGGSQPLNNSNSNSNLLSEGCRDVFVVQNILHEGQDLSGEDTTWSDDFFDADKSASDLHLAMETALNKKSKGDAGEQSQSSFNMNNNRAVGVAYPMNQRPAKASQMVRPTFVSSQRVKLGSQSIIENYGSTETTQKSPYTRGGTFSRIVTNPNYLPVTPCIQRPSYNANSSSQKEDRTNTEMSTFSPTQESYTREKRKLVPETSFGFDLNFPPPPSCIFSPTQERVQLDSFSSKTPSTLKFPNPPGKDELPPPRQKSKGTPNGGETSPKNILPSSVSGESSSSGFVSSSPRASFKDTSGADRRACIIAKGILSAQTTLASPSLKRSRSKKKKLHGMEDDSEETENIYDEVFEESSSTTKECTPLKRFSQRTSQCLDDYDEVSYRSPEFHCASSDEEDLVDEKSAARTPIDGLASTPDDRLKSKKKSIRLFRSSKKSKKNKRFHGVMQNDETFMSPSYDEEPEVPVVEGWEEIDYSSGAFTESSFADPYSTCPRFYDDSSIPINGESDSSQNKKKFDFYTMRPKNRMRQKMPKMRNTSKKWTLANNPLPVPTPAVPDA